MKDRPQRPWAPPWTGLRPGVPGDGKGRQPRSNGKRPMMGLRFSLRDLVSRLVVTLSIEGNTLRVMGCRSRKVEFWLSVGFDSELVQDGFVVDPPRMGQAIADAFRRRNLPTDNVVCAFPGYGAAVRSFYIPRIAGHLDAVVPREARRLMGMGPAMDSMHLAWQRLGTLGNQERIFAAAIPRRPLEAMAQALQFAGIPPSVFELKPLALARAVNQADAIVLNAECNSIDVVVVRDGVPQAIRSVYTQEMTSEELLASLMAEASSAVEQARKEASLPPDTRLYLTGDLVGREGLAYLVESWLGQPPSTLTPPLQMPREFPVSRFAVNVGLALRQM